MTVIVLVTRGTGQDGAKRVNSVSWMTVRFSATDWSEM